MTEDSDIEDVRVRLRRIEVEAEAHEILANRRIEWRVRIEFALLMAVVAWLWHVEDWPHGFLWISFVFVTVLAKLANDVSQLRRQVRALVALQIGKFDTQD